MPREHNIVKMNLDKDTRRKNKHKMLTEKMASVKRMKEEEFANKKWDSTE